MNIRRGLPLVVLLLLLVAGCTIPAGEAPGADPLDRFLSPLQTGAEIVALGIEILGILVIVKGAMTATLAFMQDWITEFAGLSACRDYRQQLGLAILLGLEFLVAGDIIRTVAVRPTLSSVALLAAIIVLRTFLSFALEIEIEGHLPWQTSRRPGSSSSQTQSCTIPPQPRSE